MPLGRKQSGRLDSGSLKGSAVDNEDSSPLTRLGFTFTPSRRNTDSSLSRSTSTSPFSANTGGARSGSSVIFDYVRSDEVRAACAVQDSCVPKEDALSFETLITRQNAAPHLFLGAFVGMPPPIAAGPLSVSGNDPRRRLIGFCTATASPAMVEQSFHAHTNSEYARVVCVHMVCVEKQHRHRGIGLELLREFIDRIQKTESGNGPEPPHGYEVISLITREAAVGFFMKAGFKFHAVSHITRGTSDEWIEMRRPVKGSTPFGSVLTKEEQYHLDPSILNINTQQQSGLLHPDSHSQLQSPVFPQFAGRQAESPSSIKEHELNPNMLSSLLARSDLSEGAARDLGIAVPQRKPPSQRSNGLPLSAVFGRAVAAKTIWEDSMDALIAHLVDNATRKNRVRLYCPDENCSCSIVAKETAVWATKELGPLSGASVLMRQGSDSDEVGDSVTSQYPIKFAWPANKYVRRDRTVGTVVDPIGPVRGMWILSSPMQFDNVSFTHNTTWTVPQPTTRVQSPPGPVKQEKRRSSRSQQEPPREPEPEDPPEYRLGVSPGEEHTIKYIMCPDCGSGPLGFMFVPNGSEPTDQTCYVAASRVFYDM